MPTLDQLIKQVEALQPEEPVVLNDVLAVLKTIRRTNLCPTCIVNAPESYGCTDCLNTGLSEPLTVTVYVCFGDDHYYDAMSQWLVGVYETEEQAEAAGKADEARYVREGGEHDRHNVSIYETKLHLSVPMLKPDNELLRKKERLL